LNANPSPPEGERPLSAWLGIGFELCGALVLFLFAGFKADAWLGTRPWLMLVGALIGMCVGFYGFFRRLMPFKDGGKGNS
jgi:ATP synthase protein I